MTDIITGIQASIGHNSDMGQVAPATMSKEEKIEFVKLIGTGKDGRQKDDETRQLLDEQIATAEKAHDEFVRIWMETVVPARGDKAEKLLKYLDGNRCDFFIAPASTKYHGAVYGGLVRHSLNVYWCLKDILTNSEVYRQIGLAPSEDTIAVVALLHDMCKANFYVPTTRRYMEANGTWRTALGFAYSEAFPYGHGEKSVLMVSHYLNLSFEESMAIRWHMGFSNLNDMEGRSNFSNSVRKYPLCLAVAEADSRATLLIEK